MLPDRGRGFRGKTQNAAAKDTWTVKERLCLLDAVELKGWEDWNEVSKLLQEGEIKGAKEEERLSAQNCYRQYHVIMDTVGKEIRKRGDEKNMFAAVRQYFVDERLKELSVIAEACRSQCISVYRTIKKNNGEDIDDIMDETIDGIQAEDIKVEDETENSLHHNNKKDLTIDGIPIIEDEEDDLSDLMDILPNVVDMVDDMNNIMDTGAFDDISSPSDSAAAIKKALATSSPKVSPQLKNLVRTRIAGASAEGPRSGSSAGNSAPTLSKLLEMPPRDPGQPLPEISTVFKAAQHPLDSSPTKKSPLLLDPINRSRVSPIKTPEKNSASDNQSPSSKSSSPTLKRLLEGKLQGITEEDGQSRILEEVSSVADLVVKNSMEVEIKKEQVDIAVAGSDKIEATPSITISGSIKIEPCSDSAVIDSDSQIEIVSEVMGKTFPAVGTQFSGEGGQQIGIELATKLVTAMSSGLKDKMSNLTDLIVTQNIGSASNVSPTKLTPDSVSEISLPVGEHVSSDQDRQELSLPITVDVKMEVDTVSSITAPGRTPKLEPPTLSACGKVAERTIGDPKTRSSARSSSVKESTAASSDTSKAERDEEMPDIAGEMMDSDGDARKKVLFPSKTYSRKERYETMEIEDEDDSSSSAFESSVKRKSQSPSRGSPARSKKPYGDVTTKTETPGSERRGSERRKPLLSESKTTDKVSETSAEEDTRVTRARAKPSPAPSPSRTSSDRGSPMKGRPHTPELDSASRTTRSRTTSVTSTPGVTATSTPLESSFKEVDLVKPTSTPATGRKLTEENISSISTSDVETPILTPAVGPGSGRGRGRISSSQRVLDSLPSARQVLESNPSSPSSTTTSSTNMEEDKEQRSFRRNINIVLEQIKSHKNAGIFLKPITAPSYLEVVKRPMDLSTIKKNLDSGQIRNVTGFERDVLLMFVNAIMYNSETTETYKMSRAMEVDVRSMIMNYKMTHGLLPTPMYQDQESWLDSDSSSAKQKTRKGRGRRPKNKKGTDSPMGEQSTVESGESESEMGDEVEPDKGRKKEKESSPDIVDIGDAGTKTRASRSSSPVSSILQGVSGGSKLSRNSYRTPSNSSDGPRRRHLSPDISSPNVL